MSLLPLAKRVYAKTIGLDLVSVQPLNSPTFQYKSTKQIRMEKLITVMKSTEWRQHKIEELLK